MAVRRSRRRLCGRGAGRRLAPSPADATRRGRGSRRCAARARRGAGRRRPRLGDVRDGLRGAPVERRRRRDQRWLPPGARTAGRGCRDGGLRRDAAQAARLGPGRRRAGMVGRRAPGRGTGRAGSEPPPHLAARGRCPGTARCLPARGARVRKLRRRGRSRGGEPPGHGLHELSDLPVDGVRGPQASLHRAPRLVHRGTSGASSRARAPDPRAGFPGGARRRRRGDTHGHRLGGRHRRHPPAVRQRVLPGRRGRCADVAGGGQARRLDELVLRRPAARAVHPRLLPGARLPGDDHGVGPRDRARRGPGSRRWQTRRWRGCARSGCGSARHATRRSCRWSSNRWSDS